MTAGALAEIISSYTREAGVRQPERELGKLGRKVARRIAAGEIEKAAVDTRDVAPILGRKKSESARCGPRYRWVNSLEEAGMATKLKADIEMGPETRFGEELFRFLKDLKKHNDRQWFQKNKARYEAEARDPMLRFIAAFGRPLAGISRHFEADPRPVGGSMFRIYRDTRFAKDKSPYKTHVAAHFPHRASGENGVHGPGFYLHLEPGASFAGGGLWHPDPESLLKVRQAIASKPREWKAVHKPGMEILGDALKRVPPGFDPSHPFADELKHKDFYVGTSFGDDEVLSPRFLGAVTAACRQAAPLVSFICRALGVPW